MTESASHEDLEPSGLALADWTVETTAVFKPATDASPVLLRCVSVSPRDDPGSELDLWILNQINKESADEFEDEVRQYWSPFIRRYTGFDFSPMYEFQLAYRVERSYTAQSGAVLHVSKQSGQLDELLDWAVAEFLPRDDYLAYSAVARALQDFPVPVLGSPPEIWQALGALKNGSFVAFAAYAWETNHPVVAIVTPATLFAIYFGRPIVDVVTENLAERLKRKIELSPTPPPIPKVPSTKKRPRRT